MAANTPTLAGFVTFVRESMRIGSDVIADDSPFIERAFGIAKEWVNYQLQAAGGYVYAAAVYNFAASTLIRTAQDEVDFDPTQFDNGTLGANTIGRTAADKPVIQQTVDGLETSGGSATFETQASTRTNFWENVRKTFGVNQSLPGLISSTSDQGDSVSYTVADYVKNMSAMDLKLSRDPYGQEYLNLAQQYGDIWGLT